MRVVVPGVDTPAVAITPIPEDSIVGMSKAVKTIETLCQMLSTLSDPDKEIMRSYKAIGMKKMYGREYEGILRVAYLIDENGKIEQAYEKVSPKTHAGIVLEDLS